MLDLQAAFEKKIGESNQSNDVSHLLSLEGIKLRNLKVGIT